MDVAARMATHGIAPLASAKFTTPFGIAIRTATRRCTAGIAVTLLLEPRMGGAWKDALGRIPGQRVGDLGLGRFGKQRRRATLAGRRC